MHACSFPFIYFRCNLQSDKCSASRARMHLQPRPTVRTADRRAPSTPADAGRSPLAPKRHGRASTASSPVGDSPVGARRASIPPMPRHGPPGNRAARRRRRRADSRKAATAATHAQGRGAAADGVWMIARPAPAGRPVAAAQSATAVERSVLLESPPQQPAGGAGAPQAAGFGDPHGLGFRRCGGWRPLSESAGREKERAREKGEGDEEGEKEREREINGFIKDCQGALLIVSSKDSRREQRTA